MHTDRFDIIAAELARLTDEIAAINRQPLDTRLDLQSLRASEKPEFDFRAPPVNDWRLHR